MCLSVFNKVGQKFALPFYCSFFILDCWSFLLLNWVRIIWGQGRFSDSNDYFWMAKKGFRNLFLEYHLFIQQRFSALLLCSRPHAIGWKYSTEQQTSILSSWWDPWFLLKSVYLGNTSYSKSLSQSREVYTPKTSPARPCYGKWVLVVTEVLVAKKLYKSPPCRHLYL